MTAPRSGCREAGGASEIATSSGEVFVMLRQSRRAFVAQLDFITSIGHYKGGDSRNAFRIPGKGPTRIITDLGILAPDPETHEFTLTALHPGATVDEARAATGWDLKVADDLQTTEAPRAGELAVLRDLNARTAAAHAGDA